MPPLLATLKHFNWKRVAIVYQKTDRWVKINEYVSKILKLPKNNITIGIEDSVEYLPHKLYKLDFEHLRYSIRRIKQKARSKCFHSFLFPSCSLSFFSLLLASNLSVYFPFFGTFLSFSFLFLHSFFIAFIFIVSLFLPFLSYFSFLFCFTSAFISFHLLRPFFIY